MGDDPAEEDEEEAVEEESPTGAEAFGAEEECVGVGGLGGGSEVGGGVRGGEKRIPLHGFVEVRNGRILGGGGSVFRGGVLVGGSGVCSRLIFITRGGAIRGDVV